MRKIFPALAILLLPTLAAIPARASDSALFTDFKKFCVDTDADLAKIRVVMRRANNVQQMTKPEDPRAGWMLPLRQRFLFVNAGLTYMSPKQPLPTEEVDYCSLQHQDDNATIVAEVTAWAGMEPHLVQNSDTLKFYRYLFRKTATGNVSVEDDPAAITAALAAGELWALGVNISNKNTFVNLQHFRAPR